MELHIFDLDGVLIEAKAYHFQCLNRALVSAGYEAITHEEHSERFEGLPTSVKLQMLEDEGRIKATDCQYIKALKQHFTLQHTDEIPYHDITPTLLKLKSRVDCKIGVASNAKSETVRAFLRRYGADSHIDTIVGNDTPGVERSKPAPDVYDRCIRLLPKRIESGNLIDVIELFPTEDIYAYEDTDLGEQAARAARIENVIRVNSPQELTEYIFRRYE